MEGKGRKYVGAGLEVYYQPRLCIHAAECVRGLPQVFDTERRPWIQPEHAGAEALVAVIERCPSGALQYRRLDGGPDEAAPQSLSALAVADGPLYLRGPLLLKDAQGEVLYRGARAALCRCGASANKPFCDNSHRTAGFAAAAGTLTFGEADG